MAARTSSFYFKGRDTDISTIGEKLGVAHILEGSVRKAGDQVRITAQLVNAESGYHLWSDTYDPRLEDMPTPPDLLSAYPNLTEIPSADPAQRTDWNVRDSDATLVLTMGEGSRSPKAPPSPSIAPSGCSGPICWST